jgi:hypothetical protein
MVAVTSSEAKSAEVTRILRRYLVEVVERHELCPWARAARERGDLAIGILWGAPTLADWVAESERLLAAPATGVAMVVAPELEVARAELTTLRDAVAARIPSAGVADFHPDAALDLTTPARLVPFLRRSPDPLLQLVPLALIDKARTAGHLAPSTDVPALATQSAMLTGHATAPRDDLTTQIATANHATVSASHAVMTATLDAIAEDRRVSYRRTGLGRTPPQ